MSDDERFSRALSKILRHKAKQVGLPMDSAGYVPVDQLLQLREFRNLSVPQLKDLVASNAKQRFGLDDRGHDGLFIRANQGV